MPAVTAPLRPMPEWSPQQTAALDSVSKWIRNSHGRPYYYLAGYAGTGKTTLARHFAENVGGQVMYGSYTGKAASVMRDKGCEGATTLHRMIYAPSSKATTTLKDLQAKLSAETDDAKQRQIRVELQREVQRLKQPSFRLNDESDMRRAALVVIDECSMVDAKMAEDLLSFGVPVLVLGDPAQLPPVGGGGFFTGSEPDFMLTDVHRHAKESGILRLASEVRAGKNLTYCDYGDARVISRADLDPESVPGYDQAIVGRNRTRHATNRRIRQLIGRTSEIPEDGDRLLCLRNNHDLGLLNGEIYVAAGAAKAYPDDTLSLRIEPDGGGRIQTVEAYQAPFLGDKLEHWSSSGDTQEFGYGYVLTCHKAQGSQYQSVIVFDESRYFGSNATKWLYTATTRASERLTIVR